MQTPEAQEHQKAAVGVEWCGILLPLFSIVPQAVWFTIYKQVTEALYVTRCIFGTILSSRTGR